MAAAGQGAEAGYSPGSWIGVVGTRLWMLADVDPAESVVRRCWELIRGDAEVDDVIGAIMYEGFRAVGSFAVLRYADEAAHVVVRGSAGVELFTPTGQVVEVRTTGAADWVDRRMHQPLAGVRLVGPSGVAPDVSSLPLAGGVVRASEIDVRLVAGYGKPADHDEEPTSLRPPSSVRRDAVPPPTEPTQQVQRAPQPAPTPEAVEEHVTDYDHLFGATRLPAARPDDGFREPGETADGASPPATPQPSGTAPATPQPPTPQPAAAPAERRPVAETLPPVHTELSVQMDDQGLIDVSWALPDADASSRAHRPAAMGLPADLRDNPAEGLDDVSATVHRPRHSPRVVDGAGGGPTVPAARCAAGHLNPTKATACRVCGAPVPVQQPLLVTRPTLGVLRLSTGDVISLDRGVIMGRAPDVPEGNDRDRPHIVRLPSPGNDISRHHVEVRLDGWQVMVVDLGSTNGTYVTLPEGATEQVAPHTGRVLEPGAVVSLADDTSFRFEVTG